MEQIPDLPDGITVDDLRFVHPELYPLAMESKGWTVCLSPDIDDNSAKIYLSLSRPVSAGFTEAHVEALADRMHITEKWRKDTGDITSTLWLEPAAEDTLAELQFTFIGFPTSSTMLALTELERAFEVPKQRTSKRLRSVARFFMR